MIFIDNVAKLLPHFDAFLEGSRFRVQPILCLKGAHAIKSLPMLHVYQHCSLPLLASLLVTHIRHQI